MSTVHAKAGNRGDALVAAGLFCIGVVLYCVDWYRLGTDIAGSPELPFAVRFGLLALMCTFALFRRSNPAAALAAGCLVAVVDSGFGPTLPVWLVLADLIYAAILYGKSRVSRFVCVLTALAIVGLTVFVYADTEELGLAAGTGVVTALFFGTSIWWALVVRQQKAIAVAERERSRIHETLAALDREAAVAHERATMARDLHDVIAGHLSAIAIHSEAALSSNAGKSDENLHIVLSAIRSSSVAGLSEMRSMIELLHTADPADESRQSPPRLAELPVLIEAARAGGSTVDLHVDADDLPAVVDHTAYRIAQEALANAIKHAPGQPISVSIIQRDSLLRLNIRNSLGIAPTRSTGLGHGLGNMRRRAELLGGTLDAHPTDDHWSVRAHLPIGPGPIPSEREIDQ